MIDTTDIIVALSTPSGMGAIAVLRVSGRGAIALVGGVFRGKPLSKQASHTAHLGRIEDEHGRTIDEVLVTLFHHNRSYTGEESVEISCHGSTYIQQQLLELLLRCGARLARAGEFTMRAYLNGRMDLSQAEAVADLIASESAAAHSVALKQLRGGFRSEIARLRESLLHFASLVELELDFSEEDVEFADRRQLRALVVEIRQHVGQLLHSFQLGNALKTGVNTVIAGRPNAGKSTLLNVLLNEERAIVSDIAGTTRDTIEEVLNIEGVQFRLIDTAGIREAQDQIEAIGVQRSLEKIRQAAVLLYVWDVSGMSLPELFADLRSLRGEDTQLLVVCNKMDRNPYFKAEWLLDPAAPEIFPYLEAERLQAADILPLQLEQVVPVSAKNNMNIEHLKSRLLQLAVGGEINLENTVVTNARHYDALMKADGALGEVLHGLDTGLTGDFIAQDIRRVLAFLGEITGEIGVEDLLGHIFGKFCIGK